MSMSREMFSDKRALADEPTVRIQAVQPVTRLLSWPAHIDDLASRLAASDHQNVSAYLARLVLRDEYERGEV